MTFGGGAIRRGDVDRLVSAFKAHDRLIKIVVAHHPFDTPYGFSRRTRGAVAVETLVREGADVFLTGHLHVTGAGHTAHRYRLGGRSAIVVEAGTATSTRLRNESNAFNVLRVDPSHVRVEHWGWTAARGGFDVDESLSFVRRDDGWADVAK